MNSDVDDPPILAIIKDSNGLALLNDPLCLAMACFKGRLALVQSFAAVEGGAVLKTPAFRFGIISAAQCGHSEIVRFLLSTALDRRDISEICAAVLLSACHSGHAAVLRALRESLPAAIFDAALSAAVSDDNSESCLHVACSGGRDEVVRALLEHPAAADLLLLTAGNGWTCLHAACAAGHLPVVSALLASAAAPALLLATTARNGLTALELACASGHAAAAAAVLRAPGGDTPLREPAPGRWSCLDAAAAAGCETTVRLLLRHAGGAAAAALLCRVGPSGRTCLMLAAERGHAGVVDLLCREGGPALLDQGDAARL
jgi:serine/threonine-protein phosphatase 6 regulatory ankyrin repeat subunit A